MEKYASLVLRLGLTFVFAWFGLTQLSNPEPWTRLIPEFVTNLSGISAYNFVLINGSLEILAAALLLLGLFTRVVATLLFLHMVSIVINLGLNATGVRDIGVATACLALACLGSSIYSLDSKRKKGGDIQAQVLL